MLDFQSWNITNSIIKNDINNQQSQLATPWKTCKKDKSIIILLMKTNMFENSGISLVMARMCWGLTSSSVGCSTAWGAEGSATRGSRWLRDTTLKVWSTSRRLSRNLLPFFPCGGRSVTLIRYTWFLPVEERYEYLYIKEPAALWVFDDFFWETLSYLSFFPLEITYYEISAADLAATGSNQTKFNLTWSELT